MIWSVEPSSSGTGSNQSVMARSRVIAADTTPSNGDRNKAGRSSDRQEIREEQSLLPGLPDDITVNCILPRLSWTTKSYVLATVSVPWRKLCRRGDKADTHFELMRMMVPNFAQIMVSNSRGM